VDCIASCSITLNRPFLHSYVKELYDGVKKRLLTSTEAQLRQIRKDRIDQLINLLINNLKVRFLNLKQREIEKQMLQLEIGSVFLKQNFMERRIDGAKLIQEVCKQVNMIIYQQQSDSIMNNSSKQIHIRFISELLLKIKSENIIYQYFAKERTHSELVSRSEDFLKLLMSLK